MFEIRPAHSTAAATQVTHDALADQLTRNASCAATPSGERATQRCRNFATRPRRPSADSIIGGVDSIDARAFLTEGLPGFPAALAVRVTTDRRRRQRTPQRLGRHRPTHHDRRERRDVRYSTGWARLDRDGAGQGPRTGGFRCTRPFQPYSGGTPSVAPAVYPARGCARCRARAWSTRGPRAAVGRGEGGFTVPSGAGSARGRRLRSGWKSEASGWGTARVSKNSKGLRARLQSAGQITVGRRREAAEAHPDGAETDDTDSLPSHDPKACDEVI